MVPAELQAWMPADDQTREAAKSGSRLCSLLSLCQQVAQVAWMLCIREPPAELPMQWNLVTIVAGTVPLLRP